MKQNSFIFCALFLIILSACDQQVQKDQETPPPQSPAQSQQEAPKQVTKPVQGAQPVVQGEPEIIPVSFLLRNAEMFEGQMVPVEGYLHMKYDDSALYPDRETAEAQNTASGVWISFSHPFVPEYHDEQDVILVGYFTNQRGGVDNKWAGEIYDVDWMVVLGTYDESDFMY